MEIFIKLLKFTKQQYNSTLIALMHRALSLLSMKAKNELDSTPEAVVTTIPERYEI